jgi:UDP-N-acetylmuramate: L-alanyl-gamma-D-glutamyl-meso-diaminopimelate ligase
MHIHLLGIGGTFMSGLALLARKAGFTVTGSDTNCYPPVSDLLIQEGIQWVEGYDDCQEARNADLLIVGNAMKREVPVIESMLNARKPYVSGPQWLAEHILSRYRVIAVAGTHGKTTTTSMISFILSHSGLAPGFLIGGVAPDFDTNARLGEGDWFVIEADEYDSAFFDKRPKFMHYRPDVAILNNLEFDHADIYPNLEAIQQQVHYFLKTIPATGYVIHPRDDQALNSVFARGQFSQHESIGLAGASTWRADILDDAGQLFKVYHQGHVVAEINWSLIGRFNVENALAAIAASSHVGVKPEVSARALELFTPVKRRLEIKSETHGVTVYDDFAHHPTAIQKTLHALKQSSRHQRIFAVAEFASYTMRTGVHKDTIVSAFLEADAVYILNPADFSLENIQGWKKAPQIFSSSEAIVKAIQQVVQPGDGILVMSNRGFDKIHAKLAEAISAKFLSTC